jgi:hypothetical protein
VTELLLTQQLESPSGTGRVDPEVTSGSQAPNQTNGMPTSQPPHSHWQIWAPCWMSGAFSCAHRYAAHPTSSARLRSAAMGYADAIRVIEQRARDDRASTRARWAASTGVDSSDVWAARIRIAGRLTVNFHPVRIGRDGRSVAAGLLAHGAYRSQWVTGISAGSRSALHGGERHRFERDFFGGAYEDVDPASGKHPVYGAFDLTVDDHGGSPRFGSCFLVLRSHVRERTTMCIGDTHTGPRDVGTFDEPRSILAGLAEQAAEGNLLNRRLDTDTLLAIIDGHDGRRSASRDLDGYVEAQVHGGVDLTDDVEAMVLDPSFRGSDVEQTLTTAAAHYRFELAWHRGSELAVADVPDDFRGPTMPALARTVAGSTGIVHARAIGIAAANHPYEDPTPLGDPAESPTQQLKYLWHTLLACGHDAVP